MAAMTPVKQGGLIVVRPGEGKSVNFGGLGAEFKVWGYQTSGRLAIVENPIAPYRLVPPHVHTMEDELSYVLEGRIGVRIGDEIVEAGPGTYIYKPCNVPHTFWNPGSEPARIMEIICPAGFENYFTEIAELFERGGKPGGPEHETIAHSYHESFFLDWVPELKRRYGLKMIGEA